MKKLLLLLVTTVLIVSCSFERELPMYKWGNYSDSYYKNIKKNTPEAREEFLATLQTIVDDQAETKRKVPPPGVCADYGFLLVQQGKVDEGVALMEKEIEYYPESAKLVSSIIERIKEN